MGPSQEPGQEPGAATQTTAPVPFVDADSEERVRILPPAPKPEARLSPTLAASKAGAKVVRLIVRLRDEVVTTRYQARTVVDAKSGLYAWDCSGMTNWILRRTAPVARRALRKSRPRAIDYYKAISRAPVGKARRGWQRLRHVSDARPGDVFAFPRSKMSTSKISGHVGFFVEAPWRVENFKGGFGLEPDKSYVAWAARILDATGLPHQDDTRARDGEGGFGFGTFLFVNDEEGKTVAYGWFGTRSGGFMPTHVTYGRVTR